MSRSAAATTSSAGSAKSTSSRPSSLHLLFNNKLATAGLIVFGLIVLVTAWTGVVDWAEA